MNQKPTKFYSSRQEKAIADYLGWSVVAASGARMFNPGDVISTQYLCECKTHTDKKSSIEIKKSVWKKITSEATSVLKRPVLFVDNGTQTVTNTWCIVPNRFFDMTNLHKVLVQMKESELKFTISCNNLSMAFSSIYDYGTLNIDGESLILISLETFRYMCLGNGGVE